MKADLIKAIKETFGIELICLNIDNISQLAEKLIREHAIKMIDDVEGIAKDFDTENSDSDTDAVNAGIALANIIKFDNKDAKLVGIKNVQRLADSFNIIRQKFNDLAIDNLKRLGDIVKDLSNRKNENTDDLDNLTKEELIARLREKMK